MFKEFKTSQSLMDYLYTLMPEVTQFHTIKIRPSVNNKAAQSLYTMWKNNGIDAFAIKKPNFITRDEVELLEREGLAKENGDRFIITDKGKTVIKTMILGDNRSAFDKNQEAIDFSTAQANIQRKNKTIKIARKK